MNTFQGVLKHVLKHEALQQVWNIFTGRMPFLLPNQVSEDWSLMLSKQ